jgi:RNA polymerase sigma factor (sigma-70 family)
VTTPAEPAEPADLPRHVLGPDALDQLVRAEGRAVLATLVRTTGSLELAEEAVQDATLRALEHWARDGPPPNPRAWLITTARNRAVDLVRRERSRAAKEAEATRLIQLGEEDPVHDTPGDDLLRLVFTCCHPSLSVEAQVALSLRTLCGLSTAEIARALLVPEATMTKRLTRARTKIRVAGIPYRVPADHELPDRVRAVATTLYLLFNEGYAATGGDEHLRATLCHQAIEISDELVALMPGEPSLQGLLALMLLQDARASARTSADGVVVLLPDQDRSAWDHDAIRRGVLLVGDALRRTADQPDRYVVEAAIAACHDLAPTYEDTDWGAIVSWYDVLVRLGGGSVVRLNRAIAVGERDGPQAALDELDEITDLRGYPYWWASRGELLARLGRADEARDAFDEARRLPMAAPRLALIEERRAGLAP